MPGYSNVVGRTAAGTLSAVEQQNGARDGAQGDPLTEQLGIPAISTNFLLQFSERYPFLLFHLSFH